MRLKAFAVAAVLVAVAVPSQADIVNFNVPLTVSQEVPAPTIPFIHPALEPAGVGFITYDTDTNALTWTIHYAQLTGPLTAAHFHGPANIGETAAPVVPISAGAAASGTLAGNAIITEPQETDLLAGLWYVNLHTELNGPGEIRGQLLTTYIPEPATVGLLALGGLLVATRRRAKTA